MTIANRSLRAAAVAVALALSPAAALAQTMSPPHDRGSSAAALPSAGNVPARLASLDARIARMVADMKLFTGELKIQMMEGLLEALVERQTILDLEMRRMHEHMSGPTNDLRHAPKWVEPEIELQPETLCSPFI